MSAETHAKVRRLFLEACRLEGTARVRFLDEACAGELEVRTEVDALLAADEDDSGLFDQTSEGAEMIAQVLEDEGHPLGSEGSPQIPGYRTLRLIGRGGMGAVYEAIHEDSGRRVALKVLAYVLSSDGLQKRFRREVRVLGQLQHPGIAQIFDSGTSESSGAGVPFFAMELVAGKPLDEYVRTNGLDVDVRLELVARICDAVHYAHEKGVVHRDLKPANILIADDASRDSHGIANRLPQPKVLDFGVARATEADTATATLHTAEGQLVGTVPYMSPEQAAGDPAAIDLRSDVYSLGLIAYELLAGRLPYAVRGKLVHEAVRVIREDEPTSLGQLDSTLRGDIETIVAKALEKDPERRYATAAELAEDLRRHIAHLPIEARPASTIYQLKKFAQRNRALVGGTLATLAVSLIGAGVAIAFAVQANQRSEELSRVVEFQSKQLERIDIPKMGAGLRAALLEDARRTWERAGIPAPQREERASELDELLGDSNFVDLSLRTLDENIFARAQWTIEQQFKDLPLVQARLLATLGSTMRTLGLVDQAQAPFEQTLDIRRRELGNEHMDTLAAMGELGWLHALRSEWREAEPLLREEYETRRRIQGSNHPDTYQSHRTVTYVVGNSGPDRQEEYLRMRAWQADWLEREHGADHQNTLGERGSLLRAQGRLEEAEFVLRRQLDILRETYPNRDSLGLWVPLRNFSNFLLHRGKLEEAEALIRESIEGIRSIVGEDHYQTVGAKSVLEEALRLQGKPSESDSGPRVVPTDTP